MHGLQDHQELELQLLFICISDGKGYDYIEREREREKRGRECVCDLLLSFLFQLNESRLQVHDGFRLHITVLVLSRRLAE